MFFVDGRGLSTAVTCLANCLHCDISVPPLTTGNSHAGSQFSWDYLKGYAPGLR